MTDESKDITPHRQTQSYDGVSQSVDIYSIVLVR